MEPKSLSHSLNGLVPILAKLGVKVCASIASIEEANEMIEWGRGDPAIWPSGRC